VPVSDHIVDYAVNLVRATRPHEKDTPEFINNWLTWGAGPRAAQYLVLGAKARAVTRGRLNVSAEDLRQMAKPVLRHRLITNFNADAEGVDADAIIDKLIATVPEPGPEAYR
jgi:MoxR-like ATPase